MRTELAFVLMALTILCIPASAQMDENQEKIEIANVSSASDIQAVDYLEPLDDIQSDVVPSEENDQSPWLRHAPVFFCCVGNGGIIVNSSNMDY
jgi:hypothetical protein